MKNLGPYPWVTVMVACHDGDVALFPRALASLKAQELDHQQIQVLIAYDGKPGSEALDILEGCTADHDFHAVEICGWDVKTGYYTAPRNRALPLVQGLYLSTMDADNEFHPCHLSGLLAAIRYAHPETGWAPFVYSRREYVVDNEEMVPERYWFWDAPEMGWRLHGYITGAEPYPDPPTFSWDEKKPEWNGIPVEPKLLPRGPSPFVEWTVEHVSALVQSPMNNFVDTGDMLMSVGALYHLANLTGFVWDPNVRRFGDWDLVQRMARAGIRGRAVDQITNIYHWTGKNLQLTRWASEVDIIPASVYERLKEQGFLREDAEKGITAAHNPEDYPPVPGGAVGGAISA